MITSYLILLAGVMIGVGVMSLFAMSGSQSDQEEIRRLQAENAKLRGDTA